MAIQYVDASAVLRLLFREPGTAVPLGEQHVAQKHEPQGTQGTQELQYPVTPVTPVVKAVHSVSFEGTERGARSFCRMLQAKVNP
jgi:hypothetical protein